MIKTIRLIIKQHYQESHLFLVFIFSIKSTLLFALLTSDRRPVFLLRVCATLALVSNESCNYVAVFTGRGLAVLLDVEFTLFADSAGIPFAANKL
jgi:hypothetical protein